MKSKFRNAPSGKFTAAPRAAPAILWPILGVVLLILGCVLVSGHRHFWLDELLTFYPATDPSFSHLLKAQQDLINSAPPFYSILIWVWAHVFGPSELSLRLFSCLGFCTAFVILWATFRRVYGAWPAAFGLLACFTSSSLIFTHNAEARSYGLLATELACATAIYVHLASAPRAGWGWLAGNLAVHAALVMTHYVAFFYSGAFCLAFLFAQRTRGTWDMRALASIPVAWLAFLPWVPAFIHHGEFSRPHGWIAIPDLDDLLTSFDFSLSHPALLTLAVLALWLILSEVLRHRPEAATSHPGLGSPLQQTPILKRNDATSLLILALSLLLVPVGLWVYSLISVPIFLDRYYYLAILAWIILLAHAAGLLDDLAATAAKAAKTSLGGRLALLPKLILGFILALLAVTFLNNAVMYQDPLFDISEGPPSEFAGLPVVVESAHEFLPRYFYSSPSSPYIYLLDWDTVTDPSAPRSAVNEYQILEALHRQYPPIPVQRAEEFLAQHRQFVVLHVPPYHWLDRLMSSHPAYVARSVHTSNSIFVLVTTRP